MALTLFWTFYFNGLLFCLTLTGEVFQCKFAAIFSEVNFVTGIADGIIILGDQAEGSDHDQHLTEFLCLRSQYKLKLVIMKCSIKPESFFQHSLYLA